VDQAGTRNLGQATRKKLVLLFVAGPATTTPSGVLLYTGTVTGLARHIGNVLHADEVGFHWYSLYIFACKADIDVKTQDFANYRISQSRISRYAHYDGIFHKQIAVVSATVPPQT
jgi:hypothetical protein